MIPEHLMMWWHEIERVSKHDYKRAMRMARKWGAALAEHDMQQTEKAAA